MDNKIEKELSIKIYFLNFFFTICILIHHSNIDGMYQFNNEIILNILKFIGNIGILAMPFFFFTSGFLFFYNYDKENGIKKIISRLKSLLIPYIIWNIIAIILFKLNINIGLLGIFKYFIVYNQNLPANSVLWYIFRLLTYIIVSPIIIKLIKNKKIFLFMILILHFINIYFNTSYYSFLYWLPAYMVGAYIGKNNLSYFNNLAKKTVENNFPFFIMLILFCFLFIFSMPAKLVYILKNIGICIFYLGIKYMNVTKISDYIIQIPFFIYCCHGIVIFYVKNYFVSNILISSGFTYILIYFLISVVSFIIINIIYFMLNKYFNTVLKILTGSRSTRKNISCNENLFK